MAANLSWSVPAFDVVLAVALICFAAVLLTTPDLFKAIVVFIVFGVLMAVIWARLGAFDIALAEAAISTGLTGALLLNAYGDLSTSASSGPDTCAEPDAAAADQSSAAATRERRPLSIRALCALLLMPVAVILVLAVMSAPARLSGVRPWVTGYLERSGVDNPVTAVLLNFRGYDTLLELAVILLALIGAWSQRLQPPRLEVPPPGPVLQAAVRILVPGIVLIGGYLLWRGTRDPGGAFQAGAVLAGAGVLLLLAEHPLPARWRGWPLRLGLAMGVIVFALVGVASMLVGQHFLFYRGARAGAWIMVIEAAATISIALGLSALFAGQPPAGSSEDGE